MRLCRTLSQAGVALAALALAGCTGPWQPARQARAVAPDTVIRSANRLCHGMHRQLTRAALQPGYPDFVSSQPSRADLTSGGEALARYELPILLKGLAKLDALGEPATHRTAWDRFRHAFHTWLAAFRRQIHAMRAGNVPAFQRAEQPLGELSRALERYAGAAGAYQCAGL